ncbi:MAG: FKBP-type peptidyl-prolyl cis-trans isomerase [Gallionella sp.]
MMKKHRNMKWILLLSLGLFGHQAIAEESVVIDNQSLGETPAGTTAGVNPSASADYSQEDANARNKEQLLKGGKMSLRQKAALAKGELAESNKQVGADFLATHKAKPGVVSLPSGVQYKILRSGKGTKPTENSVIRCRYKGKLIDGSTIDKSDEKKPSTIKVSGLLEGLKQAVILMPTGSKWEIVVPPELGYGAFGNRGVGPNAVLIYEMDIIGVK